ncbi:MAG TPA: class I SAM-dependent methyltransferase [Chloroflexota bacterium]
MSKEGEYGGELSRLRATYAAREADPLVRRRERVQNLGHVFNREQLRHELSRLIQRYFGGSLAGQRILEVGCGAGAFFEDLQVQGAQPELYWGVDILPDRLVIAEKRFPAAHFLISSGHQLPFPDANFDLVCQGTMMSSILDATLKQAIAGEMDRVLSHGGHILWYDFWVNPTNRKTRGIRRREIRSLFPTYSLEARRVTLAPPVARLLAPHSLTMCRAMAASPILRTHYLAVLTKARRARIG